MSIGCDVILIWEEIRITHKNYLYLLKLSDLTIVFYIPGFQQISHTNTLAHTQN